MVYLRQSRYREAVDCFEPLMGDALVGNTAVQQNLALAYVGLADEAKAMRVLSTLGWSDDRLAKELESLRQVVASRVSPR